jgi:hypothetical protein
MQVRDQLDEYYKRYSEQQAHDTPQSAPEENPNRLRQRPDTHAIGNEFQNKKIRGYDMQEENGKRLIQKCDRTRCAEIFRLIGRQFFWRLAA